MALIDLDIAGQPDDAPRRRLRVPKHIVWGLAGLVLGAVAVGVIHVSSAPPHAPRTVLSAPSSPAARGLPDDASDLIAGANRRLSAGALGGALVASLNSRLLAWPARDGAPRDQAFRSTAAQPPGQYTLLLFCVGSGRVAVVLRVGSAIDTEIADCADANSPSQLVLPWAAGDVEVRMTAVDTEDVAISAAVIRT